MRFLTALLSASLAATGLAMPAAITPRQAGTVYSKCSKSGVIALTFDDGPGQYMTQLLSVLNNAGVKATFFVTGTLYGCIYARESAVKAAYDAGHQIASHTWTHSDLSGKSAADITTEMTRLEGALVNIIGKKPTYMRPPYLSTGGSVQSTMGTLGYKIVTCDIDSQDWNGATPAASLQKFQSAGASGQGHIPLMHETVQTTATQLAGMVINWAKQNNLQMVTIEECLGQGSAYATGTPGASRSC